MHPGLRRDPRYAVALMITLWMITASGCALNQDDGAQQTPYERGENIYLGKESTPARIAGHQDPLPPKFTRCINCHASGRTVSGNTESAPSLSRASLLQTQARRGGPAFAYERISFCATLRSGVDPEHVVLNRAMPRFDMDNEQCLALWLYLTEKRNDEKQ